MKKLVVVLMLVLGVVSFADWDIMSSGYDKMSNIDMAHPGVTVLRNHKTGKYDIYRFTMSHGFWADAGYSLSNAAMKNNINGVACYQVLKYKGKKCLNLTQEEVSDILNAIDYKESAGY